MKLFPFKDWGHYNEEGYRKISELLFRKIEKKIFITNQIDLAKFVATFFDLFKKEALSIKKI